MSLFHEGGSMTLATAYCRSENVGIEPIVISELKLRDVQRHIFGADLVEAANDAAFEDAPKAFNRVRVDRADNVLPRMVVNGLVRVASERVVNVALVGREQANSVRNDLPNETLGAFLSDFGQHAGNDVALALDGADDRGLALVAATLPAALAVLINGLPADESFVNLDNAAKLGFRLDQRGADFVGHVQGGFVGPEAHLPLDLQRANSLFAAQHQMHDLEPLAKRLVRVLKNGARDMRETITRALDRLTLIALPFEGHGADRENLGIAAPGANHTIRPASRYEVSRTGGLIGKARLELAFRHLVDWLRTLGHDGLPAYGGQYGR
jgi:hypothetical protein